MKTQINTKTLSHLIQTLPTPEREGQIIERHCPDRVDELNEMDPLQEVPESYEFKPIKFVAAVYEKNRNRWLEWELLISG